MPKTTIWESFCRTFSYTIFDHNIYNARKTIREYLQNIGIETIDRFNEWDYLWSDQSLLSGQNISLN